MVEKLSFAAPPVFALLLGSLLVGQRTALARWLSIAPLVWLGRRSYAIYMIHAMIIILAEYACRGVGIGRLGALNASLQGGFGFVLLSGILGSVLLLSDLSRKLVERPGSRLVLALFDRLRSRRSPQPVLDLREHR